jgi:pyruvate ferredoxin oxidoreductase gamma subunit
MTEVIFFGRGGQGAFTAARILGLAASLFDNNHAIAFPTFGPERRGAPVQSFVKIDKRKITDISEIENPDIAIFLDETLFDEKILSKLKLGGFVIINSWSPDKYKDHAGKILSFDASSVSEEILGKPIVNTSMLGALAAAGKIVSFESIISAVKLEFINKTSLKNIELVIASYNLVKELIND